MVKKRGLGKSLDALLSYTTNELQRDNPPLQLVTDNLVQMSLQKLVRGKYQPRREMDEDTLNELAESIRSQGIIQPLIVRPIDQDTYEIIAGERRFRAAKLAGLTEVPVIVRTIPDEAAVAVALIENIQRENLNPIEEAIALMRLSDEFGLTHQQVAETVGKSRTSVTNLLRLLNLPEEVKIMLERGQLEMGHARTLITLPENMQLATAKKIANQELSVRETELLVRRIQQPKAPTQQKELDVNLQQLQINIAKQLKLRVAISCNVKGKGKLVIHYKNLNELNKVLQKFSCEVK